MNAATEFNEYMRNGSNHPSELPQPGQAEYMANLIRRAKTQPLREFRGIENDEEQLDVVRCALRPGETLGQFLSRTGLSITQARTMTQEQIIAFCQNADRMNEEQAVNAPSAWQPKRVPQKFTLDVAE